MKKLAIKTAAFVMIPVIAMADQSVYIDQTGETFDFTITQSGDGNAIGDVSDVSPYFVFDGDSQVIDITQTGDYNTITGNMQGDNINFNLVTTGDTNTWDITSTMMDYSTLTFNVTGIGNDLIFSLGQSVSAQYTTLTYDIVGNDNDGTWTIDADGVTQDVDITGDDNVLIYTATGYGTSVDGHTLTADVQGSNNAITILQETTIAASNINITTDGSDQILSITQSD